MKKSYTCDRTMNKGFTKLEIILIGIVLLFTIGFIVKSRIPNSEIGVNQNSTKEIGLCTRTTPYDNPPELSRAAGFTVEKLNVPSDAPKAKGSIKNCLHFIYKDHSEMDGAEGFFAFDDKSDINDLRIYVDSTYKNYDDILTASLLEHEITHAKIFYMTLEGTLSLTCLQNEVDAFYEQLVFLTNLNTEEWKSITYRVGNNPHLNSAYEITNYLLLLNGAGDNKCAKSTDDNCWKDFVMGKLNDWVSSNPYYQKQCNL